MIKSKAYRAVEVKQVVLEEVVAQATPGAVTVGVDLGKFEFLVVVRFADGASRRQSVDSLREAVFSPVAASVPPVAPNGLAPGRLRWRVGGSCP